MIKNLEKFIKEIKEKGTDYKGSVYAQLLKNERIRKKMTLNELSEGICSISYLSKLENGAIKSNDSFYVKLFEKIDINYKDLDKDNFDEVLEDAIKYFFYDDLGKLENILEKVKRMANIASNSLIKCFYFYKVGYDELFFDAFNSLSEIKESLGFLEACCYIYLAVIYYIRNYKLKKALYYLQNLECLEIKNRYLKFLVMEANIYVAAFLNKQSRVSVYYNRINQLSFVGYPIGRMMEMRLLYNLSLSDDFSISVLDDLESINHDIIPDENHLNIMFYEYLIKIKFADLKNIFDEIYYRGYFVDPRYLGLLCYCAYWLNNQECFEILADLNREYLFEEHDKIHQRFLDFIVFNHYHHSNSEVINKFKNEILPELNEYCYYLYNDVYLDIYLDILKVESHYKEGFTLLNNQRKELVNRANFPFERK